MSTRRSCTPLIRSLPTRVTGKGYREVRARSRAVVRGPWSAAPPDVGFEQLQRPSREGAHARRAVGAAGLQGDDLVRRPRHRDAAMARSVTVAVTGRAGR